MSNIKFLALLLFLVLALAGIWYFGLKEHDYSIRFNATQVPGEIYQKLLVYDYEVLQDLKVIDRVPFDRLYQTADVNGKQIRLYWELESGTDSVNRVQLNVNQENKFLSRLQMLTGDNDIQKEIAKEARRLKLALELDTEQYRIEITGIETSPAATCACVSLENGVIAKAGDMMRTINGLASFMKENELEMAGKPRIQVKNWDHQANRISYAFCFPFYPTAITHPVPEIHVQEFKPMKSLHATYHGNYMYSHLAWVRLLNYAEKNNYEVLERPLEVFQENPELGGDSRYWRADIYIPLK